MELTLSSPLDEHHKFMVKPTTRTNSMVSMNWHYTIENNTKGEAKKDNEMVASEENRLKQSCLNLKLQSTYPRSY